MHFTFFSVKRFYLQALHRVQKPMMARADLTPARFDALFLLAAVTRGGAIWQSRIWRTLGISRATMSTMMQSLEKLGLIERSRALVDRRQKDVWLTIMGRAWMKRVLAWLRLERPGPVQRTAHSIFVKKWWHREECLRELENFEEQFGRLRELLLDRATLYYQWHPQR